MTRDELIARTAQLIAEGERLLAAPGLGALQVWLQLSDDLLRAAWGQMDRFHLAWLSVGRPREIVRGRPMTEAEEAGYVREVATAKNAVLTASLDAAQRGLPFVGETGGVGPGGLRGKPASGSKPERSSLNALTGEVAEARRQAEAHRDHQGPRAPRPEKLQR